MAGMTPQAFVARWKPGTPAHALNERAGSQQHFGDHCRVPGMPEPGDPECCCVERGVTKTGGETWVPHPGEVGAAWSWSRWGWPWRHLERPAP